MKQFIKDYLNDRDVRGGTNMWLFMYAIGSLLSWFLVNPIVWYIYNVIVTTFLEVFFGMMTGSFSAFDTDPAFSKADFSTTGTILWILFTIWWVLDGILQYQKHPKKRNR